MVKIDRKKIEELQKEIEYTLDNHMIKPFTRKKNILTKDRKPKEPVQERIISQQDYFNKLMDWITKYGRIVLYGWDDDLFNNPENIEKTQETLKNANVSAIISDEKVPPSLEEITKKKRIEILNLQGRKIDKGYIIITQNGLDYPTHIAIWDSTIKVDEKRTPFRSVFPVQFSPKILEGVVDLAKYHKTLEYLSKKT